MLHLGTLLSDRYRIMALVGHGGMGAVYRAQDERLGREVAIKLLRPDIAADPRSRDRFLREGQIAAQIVHPNVVRTYDGGEDPAGPYLVQEFLTGSTLDLVLPLPPKRAAEVIGAIAAALGAIHSRGFIHCDVKPQNILIKQNGVPVLLDFGIARVEGAETTTLIATPHYLAPERALGAPPTAASDLYALGIVLYHSVTGHPPFKESTIPAIIQQHITMPVPPLGIHDPQAAPLDRIIARLTAKRPEDRYASADALAADLAAVAAGDAHQYPTVAVAPASTVQLEATDAAPARPPARRIAVAPALPAVSLPRTFRPEAVVDAWSKAPVAQRRRWIAMAMIPLLLLLLSLGVARARRTNGASAPTPVPASATRAPALAPEAPSAAPANIAVPEVVGLNVEAAQRLLATAGLVGQPGEQRSAEQEPGLVIESDPPAAVLLPPGSSVRLVVSTGPAEVAAPAPEVVAPPPAGDNGDEERNEDDDKDEAKGNDQGKGKGKGKKKDD